MLIEDCLIRTKYKGMARVYGRNTARDSAVPPGSCYHYRAWKIWGWSSYWNLEKIILWRRLLDRSKVRGEINTLSFSPTFLPPAAGISHWLNPTASQGQRNPWKWSMEVNLSRPRREWKVNPTENIKHR